MSKIEFEPIAYKYRVKKGGFINEFISIKEISIDEAEEKISDFLEYFRIISVKKESILDTGEYSSSTDRWKYIVEFMKDFTEFTKEEYLAFMRSKNLRFKSSARANDDFHALKEWGLIQRSSYHRWKFIASEETVSAILGEKSKGTIFERKRGIIPERKPERESTLTNPDERAHLMFTNMADKEYFTIREWADEMSSPPYSYDKQRLKNNFYHDIDNLKSQGKLKEIMDDNNESYKPKRFKITTIEKEEKTENTINQEEQEKVFLRP